MQRILKKMPCNWRVGLFEIKLGYCTNGQTSLGYAPLCTHTAHIFITKILDIISYSRFLERFGYVLIINANRCGIVKPSSELYTRINTCKVISDYFPVVFY